MKSRWAWGAFVTLALMAVGFWFLSRPITTLPFDIPEGDPKRGAYIATASGCASCHGKNYQGGQASEALYSPFGTFYAPNITPAYWQATAEEFAVALLNGVNAKGQHLYPAFPYSSYQNMSAQDVGDLYAYLLTLPEVEATALANDLKFYAQWRRPLGIWKRLRQSPPEAESRGAYLVEVLGHCEECHTPRNAIGILQYDEAFEGANLYGPEGLIGKTPNLKTGDSASWSVSEMESYLSDGFTPDFDSVGGEMAEVIENTSQLSDEDREAIAIYLRSLHE